MKKTILLVALLGSAVVSADDTRTASKDSFLTQGSPNQNEGANPILRLQSSGNNRAVVGFDLTGLSLAGLQQATLVLTISDNSNNWGSTGRTVRAHRLLETFSEGNGWNVGGSIQGTGPGVTWKCATDTDISNSATNCGTVWDGGNFAAATGTAVLITNGMTGEVSFDVTEDVVALGTGALEAVFLVKKEEEGQSGEVEYFSREAAASAGNPNLAPRLILATAAPNQPPVAGNDEALTARNRAVTLDVLANDFDPNNDPISLVSVSDPANGSAVIQAGKVVYTPDTDFLGTESFTYVVQDNEAAQTTGTVSVVTGDPTLTTLAVVKDAYLRQGAPNTNEGGSTFLRVRESGDNAALVGFDLSGQDTSGLLTATLVLTIQEAWNNWGSGRVIRAHRLLSDWTEGNGFNAGGNTRGTGAGVTWNCATDQDVSDQTPDCLEEWDGGIYAASTAEGFVVTSEMTGEVSFDVTLDVKAGASFGWVVKKEEENQPGRVEFESRESAPNLAARLVLERINLGNLPPVANDDSAETFESTEVSIDVLENDFDPNGNALTVTTVSDPPNGTAVLEADQTVTYTPDSGFVGADTFTYTISDGNGETATGTVTVEVQAGPPPTLSPVDDVATTNQGQAVLIDVLANDAGTRPLRVIAVTDPPNGTATIAGGGETVTYKPDSGFEGTDTFDYTVEDALGNTATATVTVTVEDAPPVAMDDEAFAESGIPVTIDVLSNDTGDGIQVTAVANVVGGSATHDWTNVTYTPQADFVGTGGFDYTIRDIDSDLATAHVTVTVVAPPPLAVDDTATTPAQTGTVIAVLGNDTGVGLSVSVTSSPANGAAVVNAGNTVTYNPNAGFSGADSFVYTVTDVASQVDSATVTVTVTPRAENDSAATTAGVAVSVPVLANDVGTGLSITAVSSPSNGSAQIQGSAIQYTPNGGFTGSDSFTYTVTDASGQTATASVSVTVSPPPNQNPVAVDDTATTIEAVPVDVSVLANDTDPDGDTLSLTNAGGASGGTTAIVGAFIRYTPNPGFEGVDTFQYTVSDGRGGSDTATVTVTVENDETPPTIAAAVSPLANANGWNDSDVTVSFECQDGESGILSCPDPVTVTTEGAGQVITGGASDRAGNSASASATVNLDKTAPSVSLTGLSTGRRGQALLVTAPGSDNLALDAVTVSVDGVDVATLTAPPFQANVTVPSNATVGSVLSVVATGRDLAGNTASSAPLSIEVLGGGFVSGEVYDDTKGLPLVGVTVSVNSQSVTTDPRGRFGVFTTDSPVQVRAERSGFTAVERLATVDQISGTVVLDLRLTPLAPATLIGASGGALSSVRFTLTVPPNALTGDTAMGLTEVSGLGLRSVLPLGWSPVGSVEIGPPGTSIAGSTLRFDAENLTGLSVVLVRYEESSNAWVVEAEGLTGDTFVEAAIDDAGSYAFLVGDTGSTAPPPAVVGDPLEGAEPVSVFFGLSASSEVTPAVSPVSADAKATGSVVLFSPIELPSGTLVSARVEETFESLGEGTLVSEPFTQEMPLYRYPARSDGELHQEFPVTPSRAFSLEELLEGRIHVEIGTASSFARGSLVGGEGQVVSGGDGTELTVPAGALPETVSVAVEGRDPLEVGVGFEGLTLVAAAEVELSGKTLSMPGTLSVPVSLGSSENLFAARFLFVSGQRKLRLLGSASFANGRISTPIETGGTYLFFQSTAPLALVQGIVTEGALPARLVLVESSTSPFMDITPDSGFYMVAAKLETTTVTARSLLTGNQAVEALTPASTATIPLDLILATTGPFVTEVTPPNGALGVTLSPSIRVTFSEPVDAATVTTASLTLSSAIPVPGRVVMGSGNRSASFLPDSNLEPLTTYALSASSAILDASGNPLLPFTSSFRTLDDSVPELNPDALTVSFPDSNGFVRVEAPEFSFEGNAAVTIVNLTNGIVVAGNVNPDGSLLFELRASITDELQIRILDSSNREIVIEKTEYRGPNGEVAIGRKGGKIANGDFVLEVPEGALSGASVFRLTPVDQSVIDGLPLPEGAGGLGAAVEVDTGGAVLREEAELSFPIPPGAPQDAEHVIVRKVVLEGLEIYEIVDTATVTSGKVKTDSPPFPGLLLSGFYLDLWFPRTPAQKSPMGAITGLVREIDSSAVNPIERPLAGVQVRVDETLERGSFAAPTDEDGRFVLLNAFFGAVGPTLNLVARDSATPPREVRAVAFEDQRVLAQHLSLTRFSRGGEVVFNFPLTPPSPPPAKVEILLFRKNGEARVAIANGFAAVGDELILKVLFTQPPEGVSVAVNGQTVPASRKDDEGIGEGTRFVFEAEFTPQEARSYTIVAEWTDAFRNLLSARKSFLAAQGGAGNEERLEGPPSVISDSAVPRNGDVGVPVTQVMSVQFTEPVVNVSEATVLFEEFGETPGSIPLAILATKVGGAVGPVTPADEVVALTMTPQRGLRFATKYRLTLSTQIVDTDVSPTLQPDPKPLSSETNTIEFETFRPAKLGEAPLQGTLVAMTTLDNFAFVALQPPDTSGSFGNLQLFDLSDPTQPKKAGEDSIFVGSMVRDVDVEKGTDGGPDILGVLSVNPGLGNSGLTLFDVSQRTSPFPYAGFVTTVVPGEGGDIQVDLHEGFAYVAIGSGLKIVNLQEARELFRAELENPSTPPIGLGSIPFEVSRGLFTRGMGFGREAIQNQVQIPDTSGNLRVSAIRVGGEGTQRTGYVGSISDMDHIGRFTTLSLANTPAASVHATLRLKTSADPQGNTIQMGFPSDIALTDIGVEKYAVVAGGSSVANGRGTLAIVKVTEPGTPVLLTVIELKGGWGTSLAIDEDGVTVFVSTSDRADGGTTIPGAVEIYNLTSPATPQLVCTFEGASGQLAIALDTLVSVNEEELATNALADVVLIRQITATTVTFDQGPPRTDSPVTIQFGVEPTAVKLDSAAVEIFKDNTLVDTLTAEISGSEGTVVWPAARPVDLKASYFARAIVQTGSGIELGSAKRQMPVVHIVFIDRRGEEAFAPPLSDPRPVVTLDPSSPQDVTLLGDGRTALVRFSGHVTDALADITPNGAGDIREVFVGEQSFPVQRGADSDSILRPFAFRGSFSGNAEVKIWDGVNPVVVEARNIAGNVGYDSLTITVTQDVRLVGAVGTGNVVHAKFLDPFTMLLTPTSVNEPDLVRLAHGTTQPDATSPLTETGADSLVFAGTNTQLGTASVTLSAPFPANSSTVRDSVEAVVASSFLAIPSQSLEFLETGVDSGVFRSTALRLPNNELLQVRLAQPLDDNELDAIHVRMGFDIEDDGTRIQETSLDTATFVGNVPGLGNVTLVVRALSVVTGQPTSLAILLSSDEIGLESYLMSLLEISSGTLRFLSQAEGPASEVVLPTEPSTTKLVSVADDAGSDAGMFEPFWAVARGLTVLDTTGRGFIDQTEIELSAAPLPFRQNSGGLPSTLREVRSRLPLAFVPGRLETPQVSVFEASQEVVVPGEVSQPLAHDILIEDRFVSVRRATGASLLNKFAGIRGTRMRLVNSYLAAPSVPAWLLDAISVAGTGVTVTKESQTVIPVPRSTVREIRTTFTVDVDSEAALGRRNVTFTMSNGDTKTFPDAFLITRGRMVVFAIDGLGWDQFLLSKEHDTPSLRAGTGTAFHAIFDEPEGRNRVAVGRLSTTFAPITFSRWATIFSGASPRETRIPGQPWFNRQALIGGESSHGSPNQGLGLSDLFQAAQPFYFPGAYTGFFEVPFIYDDLRAQGLRSIVIDQQAGLGRGNRGDTGPGDDIWDKFNITIADFVGAEVLNQVLSGEFSSFSSAMDEDARQRAVLRIAGTRGEFDLMVIYLAGLDHYLHLEGVGHDHGNLGNQGDRFFLTQVDNRYEESLHDNINLIVKAVEERIGDQATVYGVFADHGHIDVDPEKRMDFDSNGAVLQDRGFLEWNAVLAPDKKFRVGDRFEEPSTDGSRKDSNVIFDGLWSFLNVYVAGNIETAFTYDWTKPPRLGDLDLLVNQIVFSYRFVQDGGTSPISDVMVRVPSSEFPDDFEKSSYMMLRRDYHPARVDCGPGGLGTGEELCGLLPQLMTLEDYFSVNPGMGDNAEFPWTFNNPVNRIRDWISTNTGDIVVFANSREGYQFANKGYRGQHGSLTYADSLVPFAFGYPSATGDAIQDTTLQPLRAFIDQLVAQTSVSVDSGPAVIQAIAEAQALRAFFGLPAIVRPHGSLPP